MSQELKVQSHALYHSFIILHSCTAKAGHGRARKALGGIKKLISEYRKASVAEDKK